MPRLATFDLDQAMLDLAQRWPRAEVTTVDPDAKPLPPIDLSMFREDDPLWMLRLARGGES